MPARPIGLVSCLAWTWPAACSRGPADWRRGAGGQVRRCPGRPFGVTLVRLSSKTILMVVTAEAAWLPARTPAEHLDPAAFRSMTISAQRGEQTHAVTRMFTAQADITRLTAILNSGIRWPPCTSSGSRPGPLGDDRRIEKYVLVLLPTTRMPGM